MFHDGINGRHAHVSPPSYPVVEEIITSSLIERGSGNTSTRLFASQKHTRRRRIQQHIMDARSVYTVSVFDVASGIDVVGETQKLLVNFILEFHLDNNYIYRLIA